MFIYLLVLYILGWLTRYLNLDTSLVYISKWEYTLCCVWHLSWTWSVPNIRIHLKLDSSFWIWVSAFVNHIHIWQWNTSLSSFWRYIKTHRMIYKDSYRNMVYKCRYSNSEARIQFKVNSNIWNTSCPTQMSHAA